jgi:flagellin
MRAQVRGLNQASRNLQDGSSMVQTAEGFLKESNDVLQRVRELTVQAANGTYTSEDRAQITVEIDQMVRELNRIHEDAKFNTLRLLDGYTLGQNSFLQPDGTQAARNVNFTENGVPMNGLIIQSGANTDERMFVKMDIFNSFALGITDQPVDDYATLNGGTNTNRAWRELSFYTPTPLDLDAAMYLESPIQAPVNPVTIDLLPPSDITTNRLNVQTSEKATESIAVMDVALNKINKQRADLGAFQNRLEMAIQGVNNAAENIQAAESRIRDADMALEFINYTKEQILSQSAASMTAQANMRSQLVLNILG